VVAVVSWTGSTSWTVGVCAPLMLTRSTVSNVKQVADLLLLCIFTEHAIMGYHVNPPRAGSGVIRIDPLSFLAGCRTRRLNWAKPVLCYIIFSYFISVILYPLFSTVRFCCSIV